MHFRYDPSLLAKFLNTHGSHVVKSVIVGSRAQQHAVSAQGSSSSSADRRASADLSAASPDGDGVAAGVDHTYHQDTDTGVQVKYSLSFSGSPSQLLKRILE